MEKKSVELGFDFFHGGQKFNLREQGPAGFLLFRWLKSFYYRGPVENEQAIGSNMGINKTVVKQTSLVKENKKKKRNLIKTLKIQQFKRNVKFR